MAALPQLAKATILNTSTGTRIEVMYNPEEYKLETGNNFAEVAIPGLAAPPVQYVRGKARTLTMELFFDTYELGVDVRQYLGKITSLLDQLPDTKAPPILLFSMGQFNFNCVLADAGQRFTMFLRDGTPVRAVLSARFQEFVSVDFAVQSGIFIGPPTLFNMGASQRLADIAAQLLGDPTRWREVAEKNGIDDPFHVAAGTSLVVGTTRR
jgi:hypothetical protein